MRRDNQDTLILGYHEITGTPSRKRYAITEGEFREQLLWIRENHFQVIALRDLSRALSRSGDLPARSIVLTFDDGHLSNYRTAYPLIRSLGYTGCFFAPVDLIGREDYMNWDQLRELIRGGMEIGSHGLYHRFLDSMPAGRVMQELAGSKKVLEERLRVPVDFFSIPRGYCRKDLREMARQAGYSLVCTSAFGYSNTRSPPMSLHRFVIRNGFSLEYFSRILRKDPRASFQIRMNEAIHAACRHLIGVAGFERLRGHVFKEEYGSTELPFPE